MNKAEIAQLKELATRLETLQKGIAKRPEVEAARQALEDANRKYKEVLGKAQADIADEETALRSDMEALKNKPAPAKYLNPADFTQGLQNAFLFTHRGTTHSDKVRLLWVNHAETFFLVQVPRGSATINRGSRTSYPTEYILYRTALVKPGNPWEGRILVYEGGRMNMNRWDEVYKKAGH